MGENRPTFCKYMQIPVNSSTFEVPLFTLNRFMKEYIVNSNIDCIIARLETSRNLYPKYKQLKRYMGDVITTSCNSLINIPIQEKDVTKNYYGTFGAIFNSALHPLMMCSWTIQREPDGILNPLRPIVRIDPLCFFDQDAMTKYITKTFLSASISLDLVQRISCQYWNSSDSIKVEIDTCPFNIHSPVPPTPETDEESLLRVVREHINEIV